MSHCTTVSWSQIECVSSFSFIPHLPILSHRHLYSTLYEYIYLYIYLYICKNIILIGTANAVSLKGNIMLTGLHFLLKE